MPERVEDVERMVPDTVEPLHAIYLIGIEFWSKRDTLFCLFNHISVLITMFKSYLALKPEICILPHLLPSSLV
jgi:hypothetical protein